MSEKQTSEGNRKLKWIKEMRDTETLVANRGKHIYKSSCYCSYLGFLSKMQNETVISANLQGKPEHQKH